MEIYRKMPSRNTQKHHLMPFSLRSIKELAAAGVDWRGLHIVDVLSIICAIRIETARKYLDAKAKEKMRAAGIKEIIPATSEDFDNL